ncbi:hypothetical protein HDU79_008412 [Rhizoclosmatium sp. JEL0117]|nr:hypothetical protein HDU79_008412 [Rhizoclosmatium sp. JEL0117]
MPPKKRAAPETDDLDAATTPQERRAIQELEARVEELTTASITGGCANCSSERKKTSDFLQHISALEQRIRQLQNECEVLRQKCPLSKHSSESLNHHHNPHLGSLMHSASARESSPVQQSFPPFFMTQTSNNLQNFQAYPSANLQMPSTSSPQQAFFPSVMPSTSSVAVTNLIQTVPVQQPLSTNSASLLNPTTAASINLLGSTAAERFGGPPQTAFAQTAFHAIPSLISCKWVQVMLDSLVSNCNEKETIRNYAFKYLEAKYKMLDECSPDDKARALEVIEAIRDQNRIHMVCG